MLHERDFLTLCRCQEHDQSDKIFGSLELTVSPKQSSVMLILILILIFEILKWVQIIATNTNTNTDTNTNTILHFALGFKNFASAICDLKSSWNIACTYMYHILTFQTTQQKRGVRRFETCAILEHVSDCHCANFIMEAAC